MPTKELELIAENKRLKENVSRLEKELREMEMKHALSEAERMKNVEGFTSMLNGCAMKYTETIDFLKNQATGWSIDFCNLKAKINTAKSEARKEFAEIICKRLYDSIEDCNNMTAEDPLWVNRLKWAYESTAIFIRDFIIQCEFEASLEEMERE